MEAKEVFEGVYKLDGRLATVNMVRSVKAYSEDLVTVGKVEYRLWSPYRSKLSAAIMNGLKEFHFKEGISVLYLGASTGTTPSHVSDIVGVEGRVYCIEISERSMRELVNVCRSRSNMMPILADARETDSYKDVVESCDVMYQDVSAKEQALIFKENSRFLKKGGYGYFAIKSQSIDISRKPEEVFKSELKLLEDTFDIVEKVRLEPYDQMHLFVVLRKR